MASPHLARYHRKGLRANESRSGPMKKEDDFASSPARRELLKTLRFVPLAAIGLTGCSNETDKPAEPREVAAAPYQPTFFNAAEWALIVAACDRLIPKDDIGPGALQVGVPEFIDRHMQTPYAAGEIWYMQGPFVEASPQFGYQGRLSVKEILRVGIGAMDAHCRATHGGKTFAQLEHAQQETLLKSAEAGELKFDSMSAKEFFGQLLAETRMGYFCDPKYGGNKDMLAWKMIGYPGARADYSDWVEVRDKPYALPAVDLGGRRG
jgi:gluconate 2-dehydrogenase gamma chain